MPSSRYQHEKKRRDLHTDDDEESMKENVATGQSEYNNNSCLETTLNQEHLDSKPIMHQSDFKPLTSTRDPRRRPLLDRLPFAPILHHRGAMHKEKRGTNKQSEVTPAYAFR